MVYYRVQSVSFLPLKHFTFRTGAGRGLYNLKVQLTLSENDGEQVNISTVRYQIATTFGKGMFRFKRRNGKFVLRSTVKPLFYYI